MPIETVLLRQAPLPLQFCPKCRRRFEPFMRGEVQSFWRRLFGRPYCCVICRMCKEIVGYEKP